jgi:hypothetical protein
MSENTKGQPSAEVVSRRTLLKGMLGAGFALGVGGLLEGCSGRI